VPRDVSRWFVKRAEISMSAFLARRGHRRLLFPLLSVLALPLVATASAEEASRTPLIVHVDQAKLLKLPERTATLVIGNPLIADAVVQPGGIVVITAKSYGTTNLVALDRSGVALMDQPVQVAAPSDVVVVVYRGVDKESYSCAVTCERRLTIGDAPTSLIPNLQALGAYNAAASGGEKK
jgi:Flp pilus assembly secretin CpaC